MSIDVQKNISQLVKNQFPDFYKEEGELFIAFVKAYYEWLETKEWDNTENVSPVLHHARNLTNYRDIDATLDEFILSFKNKYLSNIQFNIATNKKLFIKNALEFYRAKGSERAVDLFFKLVYGLEARVYQPSSDLFRLSDNEWTNERYLELLPDPANINFVGKQVFGSISGASAFGEKLIRIKRDSLYIEVLYLSGLNGNFETDEIVFAIDDVELGATEYRNTVIGSLSSFEIRASDVGFIVGEEVYVSDGKGKKGTAVVTAVRNAVGIVDFTLIEGGWGYTNDAQVIGSERTLRFDELFFTNDDYYYQTLPFERFKLIYQDLHRFYLDTANTDSTAAALELNIGTTLYLTANDGIDANVVFEGVLVDKSSADNYLVVNYTKANYANNEYGDVIDDDDRVLANTEIGLIFKSNTEYFALDSGTSGVDVSVEANVIAVSNTFTLEYTTDLLLPLSSGNFLVQKNDYGHIYARVEVANTFANNISGQTYVNAVRKSGSFRTNRPFYLDGNASEDNEFEIIKLSNVAIGLIAGTGSEDLPFKTLANTYSSNSEMQSYAPGNANNKTSTYTTEAAFNLSTFTEQQTQFYYETTDRNGGPLLINTIPLDTVISETANIDISAPGNSEIDWIHSGNTIIYNTTTLEDALNYTNEGIEISSIDSIVVTNPGEGYGDNPFFVVYDPLTSHIDRHDFYIRYYDEGDDQNLLKTFRIGEKIIVRGSEETKEARIYDFNIQTREIFARRLNWTSLKDDYIDGANGYINFFTSDDFKIGDTITGETSGVSVVAEVVDETRMLDGPGINSEVESIALSGTGFATRLQILNSGFGYFGKNYNNAADVYEQGESLVLASSNDPNKTISVKGYLGQNGVAPGSHPNRRSFLSSDKYIADNDFYQEYSYQVLAALPFSKYKQTLVEVLHVAGSKPFGGYVGTSEASIDITPTDTINLYDIKQYGLFVNQNTFYSANVA